MKADKDIKNARLQSRKLAAVKLDTVTKELSVPLRQMGDGYRKVLRGLHPYERVVADLTVRALEKDGTASLSVVLADLKALHKEVTSTGKALASQAKDCASAAEALQLAEDGGNDIAGILERPEAQATLLQMMQIQKALRKVPVIELGVPSVVLVGAPNVGKSSIVRKVSSGTPEVNAYPFTTRGVTLGHMLAQDAAQQPGSALSHATLARLKGRGTRYQVMDSPGVLAGRLDTDRNEMESLTIASLQHLPTAVIFVADLSGLSGDDKSSVEHQCSVRRELRERFPRRPWLDVISKSDLAYQPGAVEAFLDAVRDTDTVATPAAVAVDEGGEAVVFRAAGTVPEVLRVSSESGDNITELKARMRSMLASVDAVLRAYETSQAQGS